MFEAIITVGTTYRGWTQFSIELNGRTHVDRIQGDESEAREEAENLARQWNRMAA